MEAVEKTWHFKKFVIILSGKLTIFRYDCTTFSH